MRLVILQDYLRVGGTERQTLYLAQRAAEEKDEVTLILFRPGGPLADQLDGAPYKVRVLQSVDTGISLLALGLQDVLDEARPEVILCMGRTANCLAAWIQDRRPTTRVVTTIRTGKVLFPWHIGALGMTRAVLVNSRWWLRRLRERGVPAERIHVVRNALLSGGIPKPALETRRKWRARSAIGENTVVLLQVAGFRRGKRHGELIRRMRLLAAREHLPAWELWLVGDGSERARCERLAASLGIAEKIRFWGYQRDPHPFYSAADVAVSASGEDSLPNFLIEAQSHGLPVVADNCRGVREACLPGESGRIVQAGDREGFITALDTLIANPADRKRMGQRGAAFAREAFSAERQAAGVLRFLRDLE